MLRKHGAGEHRIHDFHRTGWRRRPPSFFRRTIGLKSFRGLQSVVHLERFAEKLYALRGARHEAYLFQIA